ncbi:MAG: Uma2 family endonuclease [Chloroflexi bacterium CFX4]|nr:Uma2 family endonuclease [Chloroflexi bacterium CFX4]MDL1923919.1 Uma2 family endonuclease [Chloroflexi bacterium CFX3]
MDAPSAEKSKLSEQAMLRLAAEGQSFEVVDGVPVPMSPVGFRHVWIAANVYRLLYAYATQHQLGYVCTDSLIYVLHTDSDGVRLSRVPDASFIRKGRLPKGFDLARPFPGAPDLAIEVMSPEDTAAELLRRIRDYHTHGTAQVWVIYPEQRELHQYIKGEKNARLYTEADNLDAAPLLEGLHIALTDVFQLPDVDE